MEAEDMDFTPKHLADLIQAIEGGTIRQMRKKYLQRSWKTMWSHWHTWKKKPPQPTPIVAPSKEQLIRYLRENPKTVEEFHSGKGSLGFLVGQVMKKMRGKADPGMVNELLRKKL